MEEKNAEFLNGDPDYEQNNSALKQVTSNFQTDKNYNINKLTKILSDEFDRELNERQKQIEHIQNQIGKAKKLLHLVRYVIVTSYYNQPELEYSNTEESKDLDVNIGNELPGQKRIHPAIKKLLGKNASLEFLANRSKRRTTSTCKMSEKSKDITESEPKRFKSEPVDDTVINPQSFKNERFNEVNSEMCRNRKKIKHRIIVGNVSKWIPSIDNDNLTHKWMVYVRGPKETPDVSHFIQSIKFHLHPSYKPHDIVEISEQPFHLSRRGWGEFPMRIQIFFKCSLNKPVDIIHNLKLDLTCSGRQVLGNETLIDLYLYQNELIKKTVPNELDVLGDINNIKKETCNTMNRVQMYKNPQCRIVEEINIDVGEETFQHNEEYKLEPLEEYISTKIEHDYCFGDLELEENKVPNIIDNDEIIDHCYSLPATSEYLNLDKPAYKEELVNNDSDCKDLIYGLGDNYLRTYDEDSNVSYDYRNAVVFLNEHKAQTSHSLSQSQPLSKHIFQKQINTKLQLTGVQQVQNLALRCEKYKITLPLDNYKNMGEILPFLFNKLPLFSNDAHIAEYKHLYPFTATSLDEYSNWNIGKRLNSEWNRAKLIGKILKNFNTPNIRKWNTRALIMYGRSHGYTPLTTYTIFSKNLPEISVINSCYNESRTIRPFSLKKADCNVQIDCDRIENSSTDDMKKIQYDQSPQGETIESRFIKHTAFDVGVILRSEEIEPSITINGAEKMILEAVKCLINNLIRRSRHHLVCVGNFDEDNSVISKEEVELAIQDRPEIKSIIESAKNRRDMEFYM